MRKKAASFILILILCASLLCSASFAFADSAMGNLNDLRGNAVGLHFYGDDFFGGSQIPVQVDVYCAALDRTSQQAESLRLAIDSYVRRIASLSDAATEGSDVKRFNDAESGATVEISREVADMVQIAAKSYVSTSGAYDPSAYRLVDLWGFSSRTYGFDGNLPYDRQWQSHVVTENGVTYEAYYLPLPAEKYIEAFRQLCDFSSIQISESGGKYYLTKNCPDVTVDGVSYSQWIDLGGIAKGYIADGIGALLESLGYNHYFVDCGSSSMKFTSYEDGSPINIGIQNPVRLAEPYAKINFSDTVLSTSGQHIRQYVTDGVRYCHIIDPSTGYPTQSQIESVTVFGGTAGEADCLTTALTVMGLDKAIDFLNSVPCHEAGYNVCGVLKQGDVCRIFTNVEPKRFSELGDFSFATAFRSTENEDLLNAGINEEVFYVGPPAELSTAKVVIYVLAGFAALLIIYLVTAFAIKRNRSAENRINSVKKDKFFKLPDLIVYGATAAVILVLFAVFVFAPKVDVAQSIKIVDFAGNTLFTCNAQGQWAQYSDETYQIDVVEGQQLTVTVTNTAANWHNTLRVRFENGGIYAKMVDADCGLHKECVNYFPEISRRDNVIICNPHGIKVIASEQDYVLV